MSLLSRLERMGAKDSEFKNQPATNSPIVINHVPERSKDSAVVSEANESVDQEAANGSSGASVVAPSTVAKAAQSLPLTVEASAEEPHVSNEPRAIREVAGEVADVASVSKPSMIKVSDGAVTAPLSAVSLPNGRPGPSSTPHAGTALPNGIPGRNGDGTDVLHAVQNVSQQTEARDDQDDVNRLYRLKHLVFDGVIGALDPRVWQQPQRDAVRSAVEKAVDQTTRAANMMCDRSQRDWLVKEFVQEVVDFGPITPFLNDPAISKITVNSAHDVWIERLGQPEHSAVTFRDEDHVLTLIRRIAEIVGGRIDAKVPLLDRPLPDGSRVRAKVPPISPHGPTFSIEKSGANPFAALRRQQAERQRSDAQPYAQLRERIQQRLVQDLDRDALNSGNQDRLRGQVEDMINLAIQEERVAMTRAERAALIMELLNEIIGLGPIEPLLNDPDVDEVMVNGPFQIYVERRGKLELTDKRFRDSNHVMQIIERIVAPLGRRVDEKSPMVDGRLRDGSRFNAVIPPLALSGPTMTIRKFARDPYTMTDLINFGTVSREGAQFLQAAVEGRLNIVVSGGTGSGKTTTLNVLSSFIPSNERIVTIEDAAELQMRQEHVVRLETRPANIEGAGEVTIRDLVRNALRMRPDRVVIGECRGAEALDMLQAMNTGHDGSLTTGHSNSPREMLARLETMVLMAGMDLPVRAIREQIAGAVHLIVHQERSKDGQRRIVAITEIVGMESEVISMQDIFKFEQDYIDDTGKIHGHLQATGLRPKYYDHILENGVKLSLDLFRIQELNGAGGRRATLLRS